MRHRFTIKELEEFSDDRLITELIIERRSDCTNVHSPLHKRLVQLQNKIENKDIPRIEVSLLNVSREEQQELRDYLEDNHWKWGEIINV